MSSVSTRRVCSAPIRCNRVATSSPRAVAAMLVLVAMGWFAAELRAEDLAIKFLFVGDQHTSAYQGVAQGLEEAQQQGEFLGQRYVLQTAAGSEAAGAGATAIIAAAEPTALVALAAKYPGVAILNVTARDDSLRTRCLPNLLHVMPSTAMLEDATTQWQKANPQSPATAHVWYATFEKYAGTQLNLRYRKKFDTGMDDEAWAGWAAVKLVSDMVAREQTANPAALLTALKTKLAFDGQKGTDLSFRDNGQLRQPLLLVKDDKVVGEAPVRGVADPGDLDSLGPVRCAN